MNPLVFPGYLNTALAPRSSRGADAFVSAFGSVPLSTRNRPSNRFRQFGTSGLVDLPWYLTAGEFAPAFQGVPGTAPLVPNPYTGAGAIS